MKGKQFDLNNTVIRVYSLFRKKVPFRWPLGPVGLAGRGVTQAENLNNTSI